MSLTAMLPWFCTLLIVASSSLWALCNLLTPYYWPTQPPVHLLIAASMDTAAAAASRPSRAPTPRETVASARSAFGCATAESSPSASRPLSLRKPSPLPAPPKPKRSAFDPYFGLIVQNGVPKLGRVRALLVELCTLHSLLRLDALELLHPSALPVAAWGSDCCSAGRHI